MEAATLSVKIGFDSGDAGLHTHIIRRHQSIGNRQAEQAGIDDAVFQYKRANLVSSFSVLHLPRSSLKPHPYSCVPNV